MSFEASVKGWLTLSLLSMSVDDDVRFDLFLLIKKKAMTAVTTNSEMTIPAIPPAPSPELLESLLLPESSPLDGDPLLPDLGVGDLWIGGVPGGGGGAAPVLNELPSFLFPRSFMVRTKSFKKAEESDEKTYCKLMPLKESGIQPVKRLFAMFLRKHFSKNIIK